MLLFRTNQVNYNETINDLDLWRDGPTAYLTLGEENGKPVVSSTIVEAGEEAPDGYLYGPYLSVFTGYAEKSTNKFYWEDASHYVATNSRDMKYTVHAQVRFQNLCFVN